MNGPVGPRAGQAQLAPGGDVGGKAAAALGGEDGVEFAQGDGGQGVAFVDVDADCGDVALEDVRCGANPYAEGLVAVGVLVGEIGGVEHLHRVGAEGDA